MSEGKTIKGAALRAATILLAAIVFSTVPTSGIFAATHKGSGGSSSASEYEATSPQIAEFMALLADPKVRDWLEKQGAVETSHNKPAPEDESVSQYVDSRIGATREPSKPPETPFTDSRNRPFGPSGPTRPAML